MAAPLPGLSHVHVIDEPITVADERVLPEEYDLRRRTQPDEPRTLSVHEMVVCPPRLLAAVVGEGARSLCAGRGHRHGR
ncbi:hypothetical protein E2562_011501 [Oryza meyeriana var. granulata]|uniref:Uncharacterized protein n=1 Tax=Oryza meyeriana var. granulata TaxID=110450 RepID=A0A6G1D265_9ORYZ|nr:hypothetical protein E2562_011501 [Oryza meyeriana var. granulata]